MALNTMQQMMANRKERFRLPLNVQATIPVSRIWEDGIFQHGKNQFSKLYLIADINYLVAAREERKQLFKRYQEVLSALGGGASYKITTNNRHINMVDFERDVLLKYADDAQDEYRKEINDMLLSTVAAADGIVQEKYITITVSKPSVEAARTYFNRTYLSLNSAFAAMGSKLTDLKAVDRLRIYHDFYRPNNGGDFRFNFKEALRRGYDFRDSICPVRIKPHSNYLQIGDKYARALFAMDYSSYVSDDMIARLSELTRNMMISVDVITIPTDEAVKEVEAKRDNVEANVNRWQRRQNENNNFSAVIPYDMAQQREEMENFMNDLIREGQGMNIVTFTLIHMADTLEQLDADTETLLSVRGCQLIKATAQQLDTMATALPYGVCKLEATRTLLTRCLASVSMPFRVQEIQEAGGIPFGINAMSHNLILCNRSNLQNQGTFILGVPGSGKSMLAKFLITIIALTTGDTILINDPDGEYAPLVEALGGTVIRLKAAGEHHLNGMEMEDGYGDKSAAADKTQYVLSVYERIEDTPLTAQEKSIIDRCVIELCEQWKKTGKTITFHDLRKLLLAQPEQEGKKLALTLEQYTTGSLDIFAHETNVDMTNRIICFDLHEMQKRMRPIGQLTITDVMINRVNINYRQGKRTHIFNDEFQEFYTNSHSADFFDSAWRQFRKRNAYPTGITQNVKVLLNNETACSMLSNSEMLVFLNQSDPDCERLSEVFHIPEEQMNFARNAEQGCGLLRYGKRIIPFINDFPKDTKLYQLMTTKPEEGFRGGEVS